jgi:hypothetical protein
VKGLHPNLFFGNSWLTTIGIVAYNMHTVQDLYRLIKTQQRDMVSLSCNDYEQKGTNYGYRHTNLGNFVQQLRGH